MKVTGWTYYENSKYIDILANIQKLRGSIMKSVPTPWPKNNIDIETRLNLMQQHLKESEQALNDNVELHELENLYNRIYDVVVDDVRENGYHFTGDAHQGHSYGVPVIDDKYILALSTRQWGSLIVEAFPEEFDMNDTYSYTVWAWGGSPQQEGKIKIPDKSLIIK